MHIYIRLIELRLDGHCKSEMLRIVLFIFAEYYESASELLQKMLTKAWMLHICNEDKRIKIAPIQY